MVEFVPEGYISLSECQEATVKAHFSNEAVGEFIYTARYGDTGVFHPVHKALIHGELNAFFRRDGDERNFTISPQYWAVNTFSERAILHGKFDIEAPEEIRGGTPFVDAIEFENWLLENYHLTYPFHHDLLDWSLMDALVWIKTEGTGKFIDADLAESATTLFKRLYETPSQIVATGVSEITEGEAVKGNPIDIPNTYWNSAKLEDTESAMFQLGTATHEYHLVTVYGTFTPIGETNERWRDITLKREHVISCFPRASINVHPSRLDEQDNILPTATDRKRPGSRLSYSDVIGWILFRDETKLSQGARWELLYDDDEPREGQSMSLAEAKDSLIEALADGAISATALVDGEPRAVSAVEWPHIHLVTPSLKATTEAVVGGVNVYAGGITWVDAEYDEKVGDDSFFRTSSGKRYDDVRFVRSEVFEYWPANVEQATSDDQFENGSDDNCLPHTTNSRVSTKSAHWEHVVSIAIEGIESGLYSSRDAAGLALFDEWREKVGSNSSAGFQSNLSQRIAKKLKKSNT